MVAKRKNVRRYPGGQIAHADRGETEAQILSIAKWQREKLGASESNFRAHEWECPLGQLRMMDKCFPRQGQGISARQHDAIKRYILGRAIYRASQGFPVENPKSISAELVSRGIDLSRIDDDDETALRKRRDHNGARSALLSNPSNGCKWINLVDALARDEPFNMRDIGDIRMAANELARHYGIP